MRLELQKAGQLKYFKEITGGGIPSSRNLVTGFGMGYPLLGFMRYHKAPRRPEKVTECPWKSYLTYAKMKP